MQRKEAAAAFTLIELLVVVAIISILASIAVPNFLEAQIRAKVARVRADQRTMATALETYVVDHNKYPIRRDTWDTREYPLYWAPPLKTKIYDPARPTAAVGLHVLTTPVMYLSSLPSDVFNRPVAALAQPGTPISDAIDFWDPKQTDALVCSYVSPTVLLPGIGKGWTLVSVGPDQYLGVLRGGSPGGYPVESDFTERSIRWFYDPTNGTISAGNVYRFSGGLEQRSFLRF
jgi:prepilin-type N-terminal cleavage/methylation domain-containing protein